MIILLTEMPGGVIDTPEQRNQRWKTSNPAKMEMKRKKERKKKNRIRNAKPMMNFVDWTLPISNNFMLFYDGRVKGMFIVCIFG